MTEYNEEWMGPIQTTPTDDFMFAMLAGFGVILFVGLVLSFVMYVLYGVGMAKIARNEGHLYPWFSWVPILNVFMIPMSVEADVHGWLRGRLTKTYAAVYIGSLVISFSTAYIVPFLSFEWAMVLYVVSYPVMLLPAILLLYSFYFLVVRYSTHAAWHMVIAFVTSGLSVPFQVFRWRNRTA